MLLSRGFSKNLGFRLLVQNSTGLLYHTFITEQNTALFFLLYSNGNFVMVQNYPLVCSTF